MYRRMHRSAILRIAEWENERMKRHIRRLMGRFALGFVDALIYASLVCVDEWFLGRFAHSLIHGSPAIFFDPLIH